MDRDQRITLARIITSALLFFAVLCFNMGTWELYICLAAYLIVGFDVLYSAVRNIFTARFLDENFLMAAAGIGAFCIGEYPEAVAVMLFYQVGELFQDVALDNSRRSIAALMDIKPQLATVIRDGMELSITPEEVMAGETIVVRPGERIPLDGVIIDGSASIDAAALTGESMPLDKAAGDSVLSGSIALNGVIRIRVSGVYGESTVARILDLVENASDKKARTENFITRFARYYTPIVVGCAAVLAVVPPLFFGLPWGDWVNRGLVFLVTSCPCALVVSVPLGFFGGLGAASRRGVLIKGSNYLEALSRVDTVVFDKTGTLTRGRFVVTVVHPEIISEAELLDIAAAAESYSTHPIAESIVLAHGGDVDKSRVGQVSELAGLGVRAVIDGREVCVGNVRLMEKAGASIVPCPHTGAVIHVSRDGSYLGHIVISDEIKPDSALAVEKLRQCGVSRIAMLTGDVADVGWEIGRELGITDVYTDLLPGDKVVAVEKLLAEKSEKTTLAFVGDGINDAPVLTRSDVGIAMGALGSDAAIESADVVLTDDRPSRIAEAVVISRRTMRIVRQNIVFALAVKVAILILAALNIVGMWVAVFGDVGVLVLAILNSLRTLRLGKKLK